MNSIANVAKIKDWQNRILKELKGETWKPLKGFKGYEVSNLGRLIALPKQKWNGLVYYKTPRKIMKQSVTRNGYLVVNINGKTKYVHRLVCTTFLPNVNYKKLDVNHIDCDKKNNNITNLEWCERIENITHAIKNGLTKKANQKKATIDEQTAKQIIAVHQKTGFGKTLLQRHYFPNVSLSCLQGITNNSSWKYLNREEDYCSFLPSNFKTQGT